MRPHLTILRFPHALLLVLLAALAGGGCSISDCGSSGDYSTATVSRAVTALPPESFVVTVEGWDERVAVYVPTSGVSTGAAAGSEARLSVEARAGDYGRTLDLSVRLETRGDTLALVVEKPRAVPHRQAPSGSRNVGEVVRPVCSPAGPYLQVQSLRVEVPSGVEFRGVVRPGDSSARVRA